MVVGQVIDHIIKYNVIEDLHFDLVQQIIDYIVQTILITADNPNKLVRSFMSYPVNDFFNFVKRFEFDSIKETVLKVYLRLYAALPIRSFIVFLDEYINIFGFESLREQSLEDLFDQIILSAKTTELSLKCASVIYTAIKSDPAPFAKRVMVERIVKYFDRYHESKSKSSFLIKSFDNYCNTNNTHHNESIKFLYLCLTKVFSRLIKNKNIQAPELNSIIAQIQDPFMNVAVKLLVIRVLKEIYVVTYNKSEFCVLLDKEEKVKNNNKKNKTKTKTKTDQSAKDYDIDVSDNLHLHLESDSGARNSFKIQVDKQSILSNFNDYIVKNFADALLENKNSVVEVELDTLYTLYEIILYHLEMTSTENRNFITTIIEKYIGKSSLLVNKNIDSKFMQDPAVLRVCLKLKTYTLEDIVDYIHTLSVSSSYKNILYIVSFVKHYLHLLLNRLSPNSNVELLVSSLRVAQIILNNFMKKGKAKIKTSTTHNIQLTDLSTFLDVYNYSTFETLIYILKSKDYEAENIVRLLIHELYISNLVLVQNKPEQVTEHQLMQISGLVEIRDRIFLNSNEYPKKIEEMRGSHVSVDVTIYTYFMLLRCDNFMDQFLESTQKVKWNLKAFKLDYFEMEDYSKRVVMNFHNLFSYIEAYLYIIAHNYVAFEDGFIDTFLVEVFEIIYLFNVKIVSIFKYSELDCRGYLSSALTDDSKYSSSAYNLLIKHYLAILKHYFMILLKRVDANQSLNVNEIKETIMMPSSNLKSNKSHKTTPTIKDASETVGVENADAIDSNESEPDASQSKTETKAKTKAKTEHNLYESIMSMISNIGNFNNSVSYDAPNLEMLLVSLEYVMYPVSRIKHIGSILRLVEEFTDIQELVFHSKICPKLLATVYYYLETKTLEVVKSVQDTELLKRSSGLPHVLKTYIKIDNYYRLIDYDFYASLLAQSNCGTKLRGFHSLEYKYDTYHFNLFRKIENSSKYSSTYLLLSYILFKLEYKDDISFEAYATLSTISEHEICHYFNILKFIIDDNQTYMVKSDNFILNSLVNLVFSFYNTRSFMVKNSVLLLYSSLSKRLIPNNYTVDNQVFPQDLEALFDSQDYISYDQMQSRLRDFCKWTKLMSSIAGPLFTKLRLNMDMSPGEILQQLINSKESVDCKQVMPIMVLLSQTTLAADSELTKTLLLFMTDQTFHMRYYASMSLRDLLTTDLLIKLLKNDARFCNKNVLHSVLLGFGLHIRYSHALYSSDQLIAPLHYINELLKIQNLNRSTYKQAYQVVQLLTYLISKKDNRFYVEMDEDYEFGTSVSKIDTSIKQIISHQRLYFNIDGEINEKYRLFFVEKFNRLMDNKQFGIASKIIDFYNKSNLLFIKYILCNNYLLHNMDLSNKIIENSYKYLLYNKDWNSQYISNIVDFIVRVYEKYRSDRDTMVLFRNVVGLILLLFEYTDNDSNEYLTNILLNEGSSNYVEIRMAIYSHFHCNQANYVHSIVQSFVATQPDSIQAMDSVVKMLFDNYYLNAVTFSDYIKDYDNKIFYGTRFNYFRNEQNILFNFLNLITSDPFYRQFRCGQNPEKFLKYKKSVTVRNFLIGHLKRELGSRKHSELRIQVIAQVMKPDYYEGILVSLMLFYLIQWLLYDDCDNIGLRLDPYYMIENFMSIKFNEESIPSDNKGTESISLNKDNINEKEKEKETKKKK